MSKINDGGPAFPNAHTHPSPDPQDLTRMLPGWHGTSGLTLRDWFAGQALSGNISGFGLPTTDGGWNIDTIASDAYEIADAMIAEREKPQ